MQDKIDILNACSSKTTEPIHRKCKSISPLCLWNIKVIEIELKYNF